MAEFEPNRCYACKKLFCCVDCCTNHVRNKHPGRESECPLCRSEILIVRNFDHSHFLCHVVINHLPLHCRSCGDLFETSADLKALGTCSRRLLIKVNNIVQSEAHAVVVHTPSPLKKTPVNPTDENKEYLSEGDLNSNFEGLTPPPIFTRHTSTPMHLSLSRQSASTVLKAPKSPSFSMKTPGTPISLITTKGEEEQFHTANTNIEGADTPQFGKQLTPGGEPLDKSESIYVSFPSSTRSSFSDKVPLKSILMSKSPVEGSDCQISSSHFSKSAGNRLGAMQEVTETSIDMDLTDPQGGLLLHQQPAEQYLKTPPPDEALEFTKDAKDSGKRVRFSDQFESKSDRDSTSSNKSSVADAEEFFEARQSLSEFSLVHSNLDSDRKNERNPVNNLKLTQHEESEDDENKENIANTNTEKIREATAGKPNEEKVLKEKVSGSSRVVMMVLVEKTTDGTMTDLAPLINSGLKKLESVASNMASSSPIEKFTSPQLEESAKNRRRLSVVSVDSYTSISSIECFKSPGSNSSNSSRQSNKCEKSEPSNSFQGGGLFSTVANAVRTALKNISEAVSVKSITGEPSTSEKNLPSILNIPKISSRQLVLPTSRSQKRSREDLISFDSTETDTDDSSNDIRSPEQKRQRAWYRQIRGRAPIDRMKNNSLNSSSRGISGETQCFQQGSLTVGNTLLPLPSRAHQATQTEH